MRTKSAVAILGVLLMGATQAMSQTAPRAAAACIQDIRKHCQGITPGEGRIIACLHSNQANLSGPCATALGSASPAAGRTDRGAADGKVLADIDYGSDPSQRFDVYLPARPNGNLIVMLHGGAWTLGDKASRPVVDGKVSHWVSQGYILVSVNTRLLPRAAPLEQAGDLAAAMATVQRRAGEWGGKPERIILMGHSSGAHIAALLTAAPSIGRASGLRPWLGTIAIDSAAYDVPAIMRAPHAAFYDKAFGPDAKTWAMASPLHRVTGTTSPMLLICSSLRRTSCSQAEAFAKALGGRASVRPVAKSHSELNAALGLDAGYTRQVDSFIEQIAAP